ncbi:12053_t:CDS:1, partial [Racocetra persica]
MKKINFLQRPDSMSSSNSPQPQQSEYKDCLSCKLVGSITFIGLGSYAIYNSKKIKSDVALGLSRSAQFKKVGLGVFGV